MFECLLNQAEEKDAGIQREGSHERVPEDQQSGGQEVVTKFTIRKSADSDDFVWGFLRLVVSAFGDWLCRMQQ